MRLRGYPHTDIIIPHFRSVSEMLGNESCILAIDRHATTFRHRMHQGEYQGPGANVRLASGALDRYRGNGEDRKSDVKEESGEINDTYTVEIQINMYKRIFSI